MSSKLEGLLERLGNPGRFQVLVVGVVVLHYLISVTYYYSITFVTSTPQHNCKLPSNWTWPKNQSIPYEVTEGGLKYAQCEMYVDPENHSLGLRPCEFGYEFADSDTRSTIVTEWELVCDNSYLIRLHQIIYFVGAIVGGISAGIFGDKFGRRPILIVSHAGYAAAAIFTYFNRHFTTGLVCEFVKGMSYQAMLVTSTALGYEIIGSKHRAKLGAINSIGVSVGITVTTTLAMFVGNWRMYSIIIASPAILMMIICCFLPESLRWLLTKRRTAAASQLVERIAKFNGVTHLADDKFIIETIADELEAEIQTTGRQTVLQLMKAKQLRKQFIAAAIMVLSAQLAGNGIAFILHSLGGNVYLNFYMMAAVDIVMRPLSFLPIEKLGRKRSLLLAFTITGTMVTLSGIFGTVGNGATVYRYLQNGFAVAGRAGHGLFVATSLLFIYESFPTSLRTTIAGTTQTSGRLGTFLVPTILLLGDYVWTQLPLFVYAGFCIIAMTSVSFMTETKDIRMPDTIADAIKNLESQNTQKTSSNNSKKEIAGFKNEAYEHDITQKP